MKYACKNDLDSLRPPPRGKSRREVYCPICQAGICLFGGPVANRQRPTGGRWLTIKEFAGLMCISESRVYQYVRDDGLPAERRPYNGSRHVLLHVNTRTARQWMREQEIDC